MDMTLPSVASAKTTETVSQPQPLAVSQEQLIYANLLDIGMKAGMALLIVSFGLYVSGILSPLVPLNELPNYWSMPVNQYLTATGVGTGWSWVKLIGHGDFLNFIGIAFLSAVTIACYFRIIPIPFRNQERVFTAILAIETLVLILGASGILVIGH
ncbi:conserved membrane hypothetical protein [Rhodospirillaceae bacterium LM-1]|nr:conserved membrane hypothetical protein [Rhodospirillaceae bacterium LM-1]